MGILNWLFDRRPGYHESGYKPLRKALVERLTRAGVHVGGSTEYPRVELHSFTEDPRLDKEGSLRRITLTMESVSTDSAVRASDMNDDNLRRLSETEIVIDGWHVLGISPDTMQEMEEVSESEKIIYRVMQGVIVFMERDKQ